MTGTRHGWVHQLVSRVLESALTLALALVLVFALVRALPGDPATVLLGDLAEPQALAALRHELRLDASLPVQFVAWLGELARGELGQSLVRAEPVRELLLRGLGVTAWIVLPALLIAAFIALAAGLLAAQHQDRPFDHAISLLATGLAAIPSYWLGLLLLLVFGVRLGWLPVFGFRTPLQDPSGGWRFLVLPVITLCLVQAGALTRVVRSTAVQVLAQDFVLAAQARGLSDYAVLRRHVLPNTLPPLITLFGLTLGHLLAGAAVLETVFAIPGLGRTMVDAVLARDYPVIQGVLLLAAMLFVLINTALESCLPLLDPRLREEA